MNYQDIPDGYLAACEAMAAGLARPPQMSPSEWADARRYLPSKGSAEPGKWRTSRTPYLREIMDTLSPTHPAKRIVWMASAQVGKTEAGNNWVGSVMDTQSAPMLVVQPTVEMGELWSKQRLQAMIDATPTLAARISPARSRDSGNTTLLKEFPGGMLRITGANSAAGLRMMPVRYLFLDEVDSYPRDIEGEGDPVSLAEARTTTFSRRKILLTSTPTIESLSRINREWLASDQRRYYVACPHCGERQWLKWDGLRWTPGQPETALYYCEHCGVGIEETYKASMLAGGEWRATYPGRPVIGFHLSGLYTPPGLGLTWAELAAEWEAKKSDPNQVKTFTNVRLGECFADPEEKVDWEEIKARAEPYALRTIPPGCLVLTVGVDVQKDRLAVQILGHGRGRQTWVIDWVELPGDPTRQEVWDALDAHLSEPIVNRYGVPIKMTRAGVDSGYLADDVVNYTRMRERHGVFALKGMTGANRQIIGRASKVDFTWRGVTHKGSAQVWGIGVDAAKAQLFARLAADRKYSAAVDRQIHFSAELPDEYFAQLCAEVWDPNKRRWIKQRARNEALDTFLYAEASALHPALRLHMWGDARWTKIEELLQPASADLFAAPVVTEVKSSEGGDPASGEVAAPAVTATPEHKDPERSASPRSEAASRPQSNMPAPKPKPAASGLFNGRRSGGWSANKW